MLNIWKTINRKNLKFDRKICEALAKKYQLSEPTRSSFVPETLEYMQTAERRLFLQYSLEFLGQIIYYSICQLVLLWLLNAFILPDFFSHKHLCLVWTSISSYFF